MEGDRKYLTAAVVFAFCCGAAAVFFHVKTESAIDAYNSEILGYRRDIEKISRFKTSHKNIDEDMANLAKRHFRVATMLPDRTDEEKTVGFLRALTSETGLYLLAVKADEKRLDEDKKSYAQKFTVNVRGDYFHILDFLKELSTNNDFYDIKKMNLENDNGEITMEVEINCYCVKGEDGEE